MKRLKIYNARILTPFEIIENGCVLVEDGKIVQVGRKELAMDDCETVDAKGLYLSAGFIDTHLHGGGGYSFTDANEDQVLKICETHAKHGTTSLLPSCSACSKQTMIDYMQICDRAQKRNTKGSQMIGYHLEGPYFAQSEKGGQPPEFIRDPDKQEYMEILESNDKIMKWSAAPELPGAMEFARILQKRGIVASIAHSDAVFDTVLEAVNNGFTMVTHLYSSTTGVRRINAFRHAGINEAAFLLDELDVEMIGDGAHLPASLLKLIYKIKGPSHIALITDSLWPAGLTPKEVEERKKENGAKILIEDDVAKMPDRTCFAGSIATTDRLVRVMIQKADIPLNKAVEMLTLTPARQIGVEATKGSVTVGKDADLLLFDENIQMKAVYIAGNDILK